MTHGWWLVSRVWLAQEVRIAVRTPLLTQAIFVCDLPRQDIPGYAAPPAAAARLSLVDSLSGGLRLSRERRRSFTADPAELIMNSAFGERHTIDGMQAGNILNRLCSALLKDAPSRDLFSFKSL